MMLTMMAAAKQPRLQGTLVLVAAAEEETGGQLGTKWLADEGHLPNAILSSSANKRQQSRHRAQRRYACHRPHHRESVHATNPDRGINAIVAMSKIIAALDAYHHQLAERTHPMVGFPTCNIGLIEGGSTTNAVPDSCLVELDRRMIPGENPQDVIAELQAVVSGVDIAPAISSIG